MIRLDVKIDDAAAEATLDSLRSIAAERRSLHHAMAQRAGEAVRSHLRGLNSRSKNTGFYQDAANSTEATATDEHAEIRVSRRGIALRYWGGEVVAGKSLSSHTGKPTKYLAIPTAAVPLRNRTRLAPDQAGLLVFIPLKNGGGILVEGIRKTSERGPRKGTTIIARKPDGKTLYILKPRTFHKGDRGVMPAEEIIKGAAREAALDYLAGAQLRRRGPAA